MSNNQFTWVPELLCQKTAMRHTGTAMKALTVNAKGFTHIETLVREFIQNALDAKSDTVSFQLLEFKGQEKKDILKNTGIQELMTELRIKSLTAKGRKSKKIAEQIEEAMDTSSAIQFLKITDNGCGLNGDLDRLLPDSHFLRIMNLDLDDKVDNAKYGGSWGRGKLAMIFASDFKLVFIYSEIDPTGNKENHSNRFIGFGILPKHDIETEDSDTPDQFNGHVFIDETADPQNPVITPFSNAEAVSLQSNLDKMTGANERIAGNTGVDFTIPGFRGEIDDIECAVVEFFWPAILSNKLSVELSDPLNPDDVIDKQSMLYGAFKGFFNDDNKTLDDFIDELKNGGAPLEPTAQNPYMVKELHITLENGTQFHAGWIACMESTNDMREQTIGLIRDGKQVINYERLEKVGKGEKKMKALFKASDGVQKYLTLSEGPEHDKFDEKQPRLKEETDDGPEVVRLIKLAYKDACSEFDQWLNQREEAVQTANGWFSKKMGEIFKGNLGKVKKKDEDDTGSEEPDTDGSSAPRELPDFIRVEKIESGVFKVTIEHDPNSNSSGITILNPEFIHVADNRRKRKVSSKVSKQIPLTIMENGKTFVGDTNGINCQNVVISNGNGPDVINPASGSIREFIITAELKRKGRGNLLFNPKPSIN